MNPTVITLAAVLGMGTAACGQTIVAVDPVEQAATETASAAATSTEPEPDGQDSPTETVPAMPAQTPHDTATVEPEPDQTQSHDPPATPQPTPAEQEPGRLVLPSHDGGALPAMLWEQVAIAGDADLGCVWLHDTVSGDKIAVLWPPGGYTATFGPLKVWAPDGTLEWEQDQRRDVGGGHTTVNVDRIPKPCRTGDQAWVLSLP